MHSEQFIQNTLRTQAGGNDYRPDIDGLRAIAVLSVLCFHAFPSLLSGGFVGVDIFFVISGFLISKHIWEGLAANTYNIKNFYARRIRRIFPALIVVLFTTLTMGWIILTPGEYEQLGTHITAGTFFVSNFAFWKESGYFDNAADTKPLLHLWSLGIEEQFYIVWPLLLAFFWRNTRFFASGFLLVLGVSFIYSVWLVQHDVTADFYSPFTRFWELALGAGVAYVLSDQLPLSRATYNMISWLGLALIAIATIFVQSHFSFPGAWALLPALGAAFLIYAGSSAWPNRRLLSQPILIWFGLISYPLYLWHWPLLSFARILQSETPSILLRVILIGASTLLAWLTYRLLEIPVRKRSNSKIIIITLCLFMFMLAATGITIRKLDGIKTRKLSMLNGDAATLILGADRGKLLHECPLNDDQKSLFEYCLSSGTNPQYALLGDSKAEALFYGLARESITSWTMIGSIAPPNTSNNPKKELKNQLALNAMLKNKSVHVVVWVNTIQNIFVLDKETGRILADRIPDDKLAAYNLTISELQHAGKKVMLFIDNPTLPDPRSCISGGVTSNPFFNSFLYRRENSHCTMHYDDYISGLQLYFEFTERLKQLNPGLIIYDPTSLLCDVKHNTCSVTSNGKFLYSYGPHISDYANSIIARDMLPVIRKLAQ